MDAAWALWIPVSEEQQTGRRVTILGVVIVPDQQVEAGLELYNGRKDYVWKSGDTWVPLGNLSLNCNLKCCRKGLGASNKNGNRTRNLAQWVSAASFGLRCRVHSKSSFYS